MTKLCFTAFLTSYCIYVPKIDEFMFSTHRTHSFRHIIHNHSVLFAKVHKKQYLCKVFRDKILVEKESALLLVKSPNLNKEYTRHGAAHIRGLPIRVVYSGVWRYLQENTEGSPLSLTITLYFLQAGCLRRTLVKFAIMKRLLLSLIVTLCSVFAWGQALSVVDVGNKCLIKNNFAAAKQVFRDNALYPAIRENSTDYVVSIDEDLFASIKANSNKTIKEVSFLIGSYYQDRLEKDMNKLGYKCLSKKLSYVTLGNGAVVPQSTYGVGNKRMLIRDIGNGMLQLIFKRQATSTTKRK